MCFVNSLLFLVCQNDTSTFAKAKSCSCSYNFELAKKAIETETALVGSKLGWAKKHIRCLQYTNQRVEDWRSTAVQIISSYEHCRCRRNSSCGRPNNCKKNTVMRNAIPAKERVAVTLRFLATGKLKLLFFTIICVFCWFSSTVTKFLEKHRYIIWIAIKNENQ